MFHVWPTGFCQKYDFVEKPFVKNVTLSKKLLSKKWLSKKWLSKKYLSKKWPCVKKISIEFIYKAVIISTIQKLWIEGLPIFLLFCSRLDIRSVYFLTSFPFDQSCFDIFGSTKVVSTTLEIDQFGIFDQFGFDLFQSCQPTVGVWFTTSDTIEKLILDLYEPSNLKNVYKGRLLVQ